MAQIRSPICTVVGHVDHGKTTLLDRIRNTSIAAKEAGGITQAIGASIIPVHVIQKICGPLLSTIKLQLTIPGLLFIDTPGHAAFTNLRKRGGSLADIAILVIDINEGFKPQTVEALEILRSYKIPFVVAANKIDLIKGWKTLAGSLIQNIAQQAQSTIQAFESRLYEVVNTLYNLAKMDAERFDRVTDYTKQVAIIPVSAKTGEGIPELLMVIAGLAQKFLEAGLKVSSDSFSKGTVLEVKEEKGIGTCIDVIMYDGALHVNDIIVVGGLNKPIITKVRALFEPTPLAEMRDKKSKFKPVKSVKAATGVKISGPELEEAVAGMPVRSCDKEDIPKICEEIQKEVEEVLVHVDKEGVVIKADSLGALEALMTLLKERGIAVKRAAIGNITKKDLTDAEANYEKDPLQSVILGFNVTDESGICNDRVKIIINNIIYRIIEDYDKWMEEERKKFETAHIGQLVRPCKIEILKGYIFRQSNPAVAGVHVMEGALKPGCHLMKKSGQEIGEVKSIQLEQENMEKAEKGKQVAISLPHVTIGRQVKEGDILYTVVPEEHFRKFKELKTYLNADEISVLKEIAKIKRKDNPTWGI